MRHQNNGVEIEPVTQPTFMPSASLPTNYWLDDDLLADAEHDYRNQHLNELAERSRHSYSLRSLVDECLYKAPEARPQPQKLAGTMAAECAADFRCWVLAPGSLRIRR